MGHFPLLIVKTGSGGYKAPLNTATRATPKQAQRPGSEWPWEVSALLPHHLRDKYLPRKRPSLT